MKLNAFLLTNLFLTMMSTASYSQDITLPAPDKKGGIPLMQALSERASAREFDSGELSSQQLSDILWAAWGINRPDHAKHTAPSSNNKQEMSVYAALKSGLYLYVPESHTLKLIHHRDIRKATGKQDFVEIAALNIVYVADLIKAGARDPEKAGPESLNTSYANTGFMAQNVYLCCASLKLACVVRAYFDAASLSKEMDLSAHQRIILTQTVGFPKK